MADGRTTVLKGGTMQEVKSKLRRVLVAGVLAAGLLAGCGTGGYQRGIFTGYVVDASEDEITAKVGKPDQVDTSDANAPRWVYNKKTFDPDNMNKVDEKTIIVMKKDAATGKLKGVEVLFL
jgi:hypothetical protein